MAERIVPFPIAACSMPTASVRQVPPLQFIIMVVLRSEYPTLIPHGEMSPRMHFIGENTVSQIED